MINFKEELAKFKPILLMKEVEDAVHAEEIKDIMDLLQYVSDKKGEKY